jgi:hypothetical protein
MAVSAWFVWFASFAVVLAALFFPVLLLFGRDYEGIWDNVVFAGASSLLHSLLWTGVLRRFWRCPHCNAYYERWGARGVCARCGKKI